MFKACVIAPINEMHQTQTTKQIALLPVLIISSLFLSLSFSFSLSLLSSILRSELRKAGEQFWWHQTHDTERARSTSGSHEVRHESPWQQSQMWQRGRTWVCAGRRLVILHYWRNKWVYCCRLAGISEIFICEGRSLPLGLSVCFMASCGEFHPSTMKSLKMALKYCTHR